MMGQPPTIRRLGIIYSPDPANPDESMGVINPGGIIGPDGQYYLLSRVVAQGNYSRIGLSRVIRNKQGRPIRVERMGYALQPQETYERDGVEDPRVVRLHASGLYIMTYTAFNRSVGPRLAIAVSSDLVHWKRLGLARFRVEDDLVMGDYGNKDAFVFPRPVRDPAGKWALALVHRPDFGLEQPDSVKETRPSMWISYADLGTLSEDSNPIWRDHTLLAVPEQAWQSLKIGAGTPPMLTKRGWLLIFHGVSGRMIPGLELQPDVQYRAGLMILDRTDPRKILYRSTKPVLEPDDVGERIGLVNNVVFPTGIDRRGGVYDLYYGMADSRIGVARLDPAMTLGS
jgi:predicted GH43/DUF377 family glycosyl hydrolase